jgi:hypothetical protein
VTSTAATALDIGARLVALACVHSGAHLIVGRRDFRPGGLLDPRITRLRTGGLLDRGHHRLVARFPVLNRGLVPAAVAQILAAAVLLAYPRAWPSLLVLCLVEVFLQPVLRPGLDGGDEMLRVATVVMLLRSLSPSLVVQEAAAGFLALQVCLSYTVSGLSKGQSIMWWSGSGVRGILSTQYFGIGAAGRFLDRHHTLARLLGSGTVLWESLFGLTVLAGPSVTMVALAGAAGFHVACALVMGLDGFLLPFLATFPSVLWASGWLTGHLPATARLTAGAILACGVTGWLAHWHAAEGIRAAQR